MYLSRANLLSGLSGLVLGVVLGLLASNLLHAPAGRFVDVGSFVLDTQTGVYCNAAVGHPNALPYCRDLYHSKSY